MKAFSASPLEAVRSVWRNRELVRAMTWREIAGRYRGSALGMLWSFISPLLMLGIYTFVFSVCSRRVGPTRLRRDPISRSACSPECSSSPCSPSA